MDSLLERLVTHSHDGPRPGAKVLHDDVGGPGEGAVSVAVATVGQVQGDGLLVAVVAEEPAAHRPALGAFERIIGSSRSPPSGFSILMTSAPRSANIIAQYGAAMYWPISSTRIPSKGRMSDSFGSVRAIKGLMSCAALACARAPRSPGRAGTGSGKGTEVVLSSGDPHEFSSFAVFGDVTGPGAHDRQLLPSDEAGADRNFLAGAVDLTGDHVSAAFLDHPQSFREVRCAHPRIENDLGAFAAEELSDRGDPISGLGVLGNRDQVGGAILFSRSQEAIVAAPIVMIRPAPRWSARAVAKSPRGPAPWMTTVSQGLSLPIRSNQCTTVRTHSWAADAHEVGTSSGTRTLPELGRRRRIGEAAHQVGRSLAVGEHVVLTIGAQGGLVVEPAVVALVARGVGEADPGHRSRVLSRRCRARPRHSKAITRLTISWPGLTGRSRAWLPPREPSHRCRSDPHTVAASTRTSSAPGSRVLVRELADLQWFAVLGQDRRRLVVGMSNVEVIALSPVSAEFEGVAALAGEFDPDRFGL